MNDNESYLNSFFDELTYLAARELSSFIAAVRDLYGAQQARLSAQDWLDELELLNCPLRSEVEDWRAITIAASAVLANRVSASAHRGKLARLIGN